MIFCYDRCEFNKIERRFWDDKDDRGHNVTHSKATGPTNKALTCDLGYRQVVSGPEQLKNSIDNGAAVCRFQRQIY
jgi:hypothetical protein